MNTRTFLGLIAAGTLLTCLNSVSFADESKVFSLKGGDPNGSQSTAVRETGALFKKGYIRPNTIPFPAENPYTEAKYRLGKALFFDPRLSRSNMQSCASCHNPSFAWGDGLAVGVGDGMNKLGRRSPSILNAAWGEVFMWDGRAESLEKQVLGPIEASGEMNMPMDKLLGKLAGIHEYPKMFEAAFGPNSIKQENIGKAIATFERTVVSEVAPFDRWIDGDKDAISEDAKKGFVLFNTKAKCAQCHSTWLFTDDSFHDIGLQSQDIGRGKFFPEEPKMQYSFKTPGLRNTSRRGPFMHDGSVKTLADVVTHYNDGGVERPSRADDVLPLSLSEEEQKQLVTFMVTLTSEDRLVFLPNLPR